MIIKSLLLILIATFLYLSYLGISKHTPLKFIASIEIKQSLEKTIELWKDKNNYQYWQDGFISKELLEGKEGEVGEVSLIKLDHKGDIMKLTETVQISDLPNEFKVLVEHKHIHNTLNSKFTKIDENTTLWTAEIDYFKVNFWPAKIMMKLFPTMFKKQGQKWSDNFKDFAENK